MLGRPARRRLERIGHVARWKRPRYAEDVDRAQAYDERLPLPALAARVRTVWIQRTGPRPDLSGGIKYLSSQRHAFYVQFDEYVHRLEKLLKRMAPERGAA